MTNPVNAVNPANPATTSTAVQNTDATRSAAPAGAGAAPTSINSANTTNKGMFESVFDSISEFFSKCIECVRDFLAGLPLIGRFFQKDASTPGTTPAGTTPVGTTPVGTTPVGTTPAGTTPTEPTEAQKLEAIRNIFGATTAATEAQVNTVKQYFGQIAEAAKLQALKVVQDSANPAADHVLVQALFTNLPDAKKLAIWGQIYEIDSAAGNNAVRNDPHADYGFRMWGVDSKSPTAKTAVANVINAPARA